MIKLISYYSFILVATRYSS